MKTSNKKYELKINNFFSNTLNNKDKESDNKMNSSHKRQSRKYDEIEAKDILIKQNISQIKKIKMESVKELIYTNKKVPKNWQNQKNYRNQIFEMFSKNPKFLHYLGSAYNTFTETKISQQQKENDSPTNKNNSENKNDNLNSSIKKVKIKMKKLNLSPIPEKPKSKNNFTKYMNTTPNPKNFTHKKKNYMKPREIINILDELGISYPIKDKINDLYSKEEIEKLTPINRYNKPVLDRMRRKQIFKNNICLNLFSNKNHKRENQEKRAKTCENKYDNTINITEMKKQIIKNPFIYKKLERINFYGPYYSYCSQCGIKNIDFYQKLPMGQLNSITNEIRKHRNLM